MINEPLLAAKFDPGKPKEMALVLGHLPLFASFKLDGVRAIGQGGVLMSRSMKPIPNLHVQKMFKQYDGLDGELILGDPTDPLVYNKTVSAVMRKEGTPDVSWYVFDDTASVTEPFTKRLYSTSKSRAGICQLDQRLCSTWQEIVDYEAHALDQGYEGLILRSSQGRYKEGRSTLKEGFAIKLKRFLDSEAVVIGMVELQHNLNETTINEVGRTKRSSHKENKLGGGTMGAIQVRDLYSGVEFEIGTGFTAEDRQGWWDTRKTIVEAGTIVKYKFFPVGVKDKPRHPVFLGLRHKDDL